MADSQPDTEGEEEQQQQLTVIDLPKLCKYLKRITAAFFEDENFDFSQNQLDAALNDPVNVDSLKKFIGDGQVRALFVKGIINKGTHLFLHNYNPLLLLLRFVSNPDLDYHYHCTSITISSTGTKSDVTL